MPKLSGGDGFWPSMRENAMFATVLLIVLIMLGTLFATITLKTLVEVQEVGMPEPSERSITVSGVASASAAPDRATVNVGVESKAASVDAAQKANTASITTISNSVQAAGVPAADIQTSSYSVYEDEVYNPTTGQYDSKGWIVYQELAVQINDISLVATVLEIAGANGATNIYGPNYELADPVAQQQEARVDAIAEARTQAVMIANGLGVQLGEVIDYEEWSTGDVPIYDYAYGMGGAEAAAVQPGTEELELNVTITYELIQ